MPKPLVCPYCYESFHEPGIVFRCTGRVGPDGVQCAPEHDKQLERRIGTRLQLPPAFASDGRKLRVVHKACGEPTSARLCPACHSRLPVQFGKIDSRLIAMLGARETGKTVYMTVLLHELTGRVGEIFDAAVAGSDDQTRLRFAAEYERTLFQQLEMPPTTKRAVGDEPVAPLVFRFTTERSRWWGRRKPVHVLLSFYDAAGEDLNGRDAVERAARYLVNADGIVLLLDPLQLPGTAGLTAADVRLPTAAAEPLVNVLSRITELLQGALALQPDQKISTPVAVTFTKLDALWSPEWEGSPLRRKQSEEPRFGEADSRDVHEQVQSLLHQWGGAQIDQVLRTSYRTHRYFGVSALGRAPTADNRVPHRGIQPYRVADPFLWLLGRFGAVPVKRR